MRQALATAVIILAAATAAIGALPYGWANIVVPAMSAGNLALTGAYFRMTSSIQKVQSVIITAQADHIKKNGA